MARTPPPAPQKRPPAPDGKSRPQPVIGTRRKSPSTTNAPRHPHGGARRGAGRPARDTIPITVRLHPATLALLNGENRSRQIEQAILAFIRHQFERLVASSSSASDPDARVAAHPAGTRPRSPEKPTPTKAASAARKSARRLHTRLRAAEQAFAADGPKLR